MAATVSIILPTYNRLSFLPAAITSVLEQTYGDWELLIADDGSDANTRTYLEGIARDSRVELLLLPHTGKPAVVRNVALREAVGEYVAFLDSDDVWMPTKLAQQIGGLRRDRTCKWSHTKYVLVDESLAPTDWSMRTGGWPTPSGWIFESLLKTETVVALPSVVACRTLLEEVGGFDEGLVSCEDVDLWLRLALRSEIDAVDEPLTLVRRHADHFSGDRIRGFRNSLITMQKLSRVDGIENLQPYIRQQCANISGELARSQAAAGHRLEAFGTLAESAEYSWPFPDWWWSAMRCMVHASCPQGVRAFARRLRGHPSSHSSP